MVWKGLLSHHFNQNQNILGGAVDEKTAAQKPKRNNNFGYPPTLFLRYLQNDKS
jgi:hypothetical protein